MTPDPKAKGPLRVDKLSEWQAKAQDNVNRCLDIWEPDSDDLKILTLIDLIRKKDKALEQVEMYGPDALWIDNDSQKAISIVQEALELTAKVGEAEGRTTEQLK